jgi:DNA-binding MarR family transcriptional regulator
MTDPTAALQRLGLSEYEAETFVALQQIDSGSASDVAEVSNVPRSPVYGAADDLEDRGLLDVQQTTPKRYRAVSSEEAREQLRREFEREQEQAFDALAEIEPDLADGDVPQETIWTVRGQEVSTRASNRFLTTPASSGTQSSLRLVFSEQSNKTLHQSRLARFAHHEPAVSIHQQALLIEQFLWRYVFTRRSPQSVQPDFVRLSRCLGQLA